MKVDCCLMSQYCSQNPSTFTQPHNHKHCKIKPHQDKHKFEYYDSEKNELKKTKEKTMSSYLLHIFIMAHVLKSD